MDLIFLLLLLFQYGGSIELNVTEVSQNVLKLKLHIEDSEKLSNQTVEVKCSYKVDDAWETVGAAVTDDNLYTLNNVIPDIMYNCSGHIVSDEETIEIPEKKVVFCSKEDTRLKVENINTDKFE